MPTAVPRALRAWFILHFALDWLFAIPLVIAPRLLLDLFGWITIDPVTTRLVGAALLAIGGSSFLVRGASVEVLRAMLQLKLLWSISATVGLIWSARQGAPPLTWAFAGVFGGFTLVWLAWWRRLARDQGAP